MIVVGARHSFYDAAYKREEQERLAREEQERRLEREVSELRREVQTLKDVLRVTAHTIAPYIAKPK